MTHLYDDVLRLSVRENLQNIRTLLEWAGDGKELGQTLDYSEQALQMLQEIVANLRELR